MTRLLSLSFGLLLPATLVVVATLWAEEPPDSVGSPSAVQAESPPATEEISADDAEFFETHVRPVLVEHCYECHSADSAELEGELRLDTRAGLMAGGYSGAAIEPGDAAASLLMEALRQDGFASPMPPRSKLPEEKIEAIAEWIERGVPWPNYGGEVEDPLAGTAHGRVSEEDLAESHWALEPITPVPPPPVANAAWPKTGIDHFILARLEEAQLAPAAAADRRTLIRRVYFDLIGLPPTPEEVEAFVNDPAPDAYEKVVAQLLESPHFGERWGRHWLDLVRYAETFGYEHDWPIPLAPEYRDYVIRMFNDDVPYDQMLREAIAGDLLPQPRLNAERGFNESIIGTGHWYLHGQMSQPVDVKQHEADRFDNQVDVLSRGFLGMTMACARCHDHKFDPISTEEYYGLVGFLRSSRRVEAYLDPHAEIAGRVVQLEQLQAAGDARLAEVVAESAQRDFVPPQVENAYADALAGSELFEDFSHGYAGWFVYGKAFGDSPTQAGQWDRASAAAVALPGGLAHSGLLAGRLHGTLQSSEFTVPEPENGTPHIWLRVSGKGTVRAVIHGYMLMRYKQMLFTGAEINFDVPPGEMQWVDLGQELSLHMGQPVYLEIEDASDSFLVVDEIRFADCVPPAGSVAMTAGSFASAADAQFAELAGRMEAVAAEMPEPMRVLAMGEGTVTEQPVFVRGNPHREGQLAVRRMPNSFISIEQTPFGAEDGSGRLELAERILDPSDPLVARVRVNWVWHHLFGRGIVASVDNLGVLGETPTHPELLDYMADRFAHEQGWSLKALIREMVLSETYRMSSDPADAAAEAADPSNFLWHRMPVRRLEAEAIRDAMLHVSGQIDLAMYGEPVPVHLTPFMLGLSRPEESGPLDGNGRRSIYLEVRRNFLPPMFMAFDMPPPSSCTARRGVSNVPAQALILMNDPLVAHEAREWSERVMGEVAEPRERIDRMYREAFSRPASEGEMMRIEAFIAQQGEAYGLDPATAASDPRVWADVAHALFSVKEFIFIH